MVFAETFMTENEYGLFTSQITVTSQFSKSGCEPSIFMDLVNYFFTF